MAQKTYKVRALVLKRVKLGEADVICVMMAEDGQLVKAVAKGARKPRSSFASRLEVFCVCDLFLAQGRNLDIVKEAKLVDAHVALREDIDRQFAANPIVELLDKTIHEDLEVPRLFEMTATALSTLCTCPKEAVYSISAAHMLKALTFQGLKPSFETCVGCGAEVEPSGAQLAFSVIDGGVVCANCRPRFEVQMLNSQTITWAQALLYSSFEQIATFPVPEETLLEVLRLCQQLCQTHLSVRLKSLNFIFTTAIPEE